MAVDNLTKIALAVIKNGDSEILIVKRKNPEKGSDGTQLSWAFPGGRVENSDSPEETAVQEALEETGHYVEAVSLINKRKHPNLPAEVHYFECRLTTDATTQLIDDHEIEQFAWVKATRLKDHFETDFDEIVAKFLGV